MSYTYHGTNQIIALPGRSVQTFPSGLVRVDRTYACRIDRADAVRRELAVGNPLPLDDGTPAIDGLYIFPKPQEIRRDDGFMEFRASGYGRVNIDGYSRTEFTQGTATIQNRAAGGSFFQTTPTTLNEQITKSFIVLSESPFLFESGIPDNVLKVYFPDGDEIFEKYPNSFEAYPQGGFRSVTTNVKAEFDGISSTNFGRWSEVTISFKAAGIVSIFTATATN